MYKKINVIIISNYILIHIIKIFEIQTLSRASTVFIVLKARVCFQEHRINFYFIHRVNNNSTMNNVIILIWYNDILKNIYKKFKIQK